MIAKTNVELFSAYRLLHPMHTVLVTTSEETGKPNIITVAWAMPTSITPALIAISVSPKRHSHKLIQQTNEFVINIPTQEILEAVYACGTTTGKNHDKFAETKLTPLSARKTKAPIIKQCIAHLECTVQNQIETGWPHNIHRQNHRSIRKQSSIHRQIQPWKSKNALPLRRKQIRHTTSETPSLQNQPIMHVRSIPKLSNRKHASNISSCKDGRKRPSFYFFIIWQDFLQENWELCLLLFWNKHELICC